MCILSIYTTLAWAFKGAARGLTGILPGQYLDIARAISWESGLPMALMPSQFKETARFDMLYRATSSFVLWDAVYGIMTYHTASNDIALGQIMLKQSPGSTKKSFMKVLSITRH